MLQYAFHISKYHIVAPFRNANHTQEQNKHRMMNKTNPPPPPRKSTSILGET